MKISQTLVALYEKYIRLFLVVFVKTFACFHFRVNAITDNLGDVFFRSFLWTFAQCVNSAKKSGFAFAKSDFLNGCL